MEVPKVWLKYDNVLRSILRLSLQLPSSLLPMMSLTFVLNNASTIFSMYTTSTRISHHGNGTLWNQFRLAI